MKFRNYLGDLFLFVVIVVGIMLAFWVFSLLP